MEPFDLQQLVGMQYTLHVGQQRETVTVLKAEVIYEIMKAHAMLLDTEGFEHFEMLDFFTGFESSPHNITWFSSYQLPKLEVRAAMQAIREGNSIAVAEWLVPDPTNPTKDPVERKKKA